MRKPIQLKNLLNEATHEDDNKEVIKFLVSNAKELDLHRKTIWNRTEFKKTSDLTKELVKLMKKGGFHIKIGLQDVPNKVISYNYKKRSDMEKLLKSGNLGRIDIEYTHIPTMQGAIDKFGTSS